MNTHHHVARQHVALAAKRPYHPGQFSDIYRNMPSDLRLRIANAVDEVFVRKTGVRRKINENSKTERVLVRQWLLIRDAIVSWYLYHRVLQEDRARGLQKLIEEGIQRENRRLEARQAEREAGKLRRELTETVEHGGLPPEAHASRANNVAQGLHNIHMGYELLELVDLLPHAIHALGPYAHAFIGGLAMPLAAVAGLMEMAEANEAGSREAERNAYRVGFASHLVYGYIRNPLSTNTVLGYRQVLGQKAAIRFLGSLPANVRGRFQAAYRGVEAYPGQNMDRALHDVGALPPRAE